MHGDSMSGGDPRNRRTGLILAAVALGFFVAIVLKYWLMK
jgi:hypothetical protein